MDDSLLHTLTLVANTLRQAEIPFALSGGFAVYARGGPSSEHDIDFLIKREDVNRAVNALVGAGLKAVDPAENWLTKVYDDDRLVDLIFHSLQGPVTDERLQCANTLKVGPAKMRVVPATDLLIERLLMFSDHECDFSKLLPIARALREQIDWPRARVSTTESPYASAFLFLLERLNIAPPTKALANEKE